MLAALLTGVRPAGSEPGLSGDPPLSVRAFGAKGDGKTKDTEAIQRAIEAAADRGGGTVYFGPGSYLSGTVVLKACVTLYLDAGATLLGSSDLSDFPRIVPAFPSYTENYVCQSLVYAEKARDVAIAGRGVIDGQGAAFLGKPWLKRPYLVRFVSCERVRVEDVTFRNSPMWVQHYLDCDELSIRGITVHSNVNENNDMLDIDCCRNVRVADCIGDSGDDAITLKSTGARPCENVVVTNCVLFSTCNAIKLGTESNGGFRNIAISNCTIGPMGSGRGFFGTKMLAGIALEIVDGGTLDRVVVSNIAMTGVRVPIFMRLGNRARPYRKDMEKPGVGTFENVSITNVVAEAVERIGCSITGIPGHPIRNVSLSDIRLLLPGGGTGDEVGAPGGYHAREVPEKPEAYPECTMFGSLPAYGFYCRHVEGLTFDNVTVGVKEADPRPAIFCDDVRGLAIDGFTARSAAPGPPLMVLRDVNEALIRGCVAPQGTGVFLRLEGAAAGISLLSNDLSRAEKPFEFGDGASPLVREKAVFQAANRHE